ncbi:MAG: hypothetical protein K2X81_06255 [Candidatus Obscuribacterales bacterium]|nr:hypothetical protein [Candidatus Obscuribacterales bacterium]
MKFRDYTLEALAKMVVGDNSKFFYRSSTLITSYFRRCELEFVHDGTTRWRWAKDVLDKLNLGICHSQDLPSDALVRVICELLDPDDFFRSEKSQEEALQELNTLLAREGLAAYLDDSGKGFLRNTGTGFSSPTLPAAPRPLSKEEIRARNRIEDFLEKASEDELTEKLLVPLFQRFGFYRVSPAGHREKIMEYGKDLWMKFQLPTGHWLYFCAQMKRGKIDASGTGGTSNVANILTQVRMAIDNPIFDPDSNRKFLLDHIFIIAGGEITRSARNWIVEQLDAGQRRHIIFMDRAELLDQGARYFEFLQLEEEHDVASVNLFD